MKIKLIIFDLDGVLVDAREIHYSSLNTALEEAGYPIITREEHLSTFDGLGTHRKLELLEMPERKRQYIWELKQQKTLEIINDFEIDERLKEVLKKLSDEGYIIACATNSI